MQDMIKEGLLVTILKYVEQGIPVHVTGYSMRGMLGQIMMLYLGDHARMNGWDASKINFVGFGCPRVGDICFAARLRVLFDPRGHKCRVCQQYGHRGRECHAQRDVGFAELLTNFRYHHFLYYNANLKKSVEFTS
ncbi:hypothetical protein KXD40_001471 [Peronospora effusa]|nr:hypothetical protein KXD40_001471 [Peronospora effusa]